MKSLSSHYLHMREKYPNDKLMVVFDIDDTIVDIRIPMLFNLRKYDADHHTNYFNDLELDDITFEEWRIKKWLEKKFEDKKLIEDITTYIRDRMWQADTILMSHRPFRGVLEIIRWFQIQNKCYVGLNTGRANSLREITLKSLNILGREFRVSFPDDLLYMNPLENKGDKDVSSYKTKGIQYFREQGYHVIAFIDNEPANLQAVDSGIDDPELLLLHAETIFGSSKQLRPEHAVPGTSYELTDVIDPDIFPHHVEFVWNGVNNSNVLESYLRADVYWAELDVRTHPLTETLVLKHGSFDTIDIEMNLCTFDEMINKLLPIDRGIKLVLKEDQGLLDHLISYFKENKIASNRLWFDIIFEVFDTEGLHKITKNFPEAIISTRIDFLVPLLSQMPDQVYEILSRLNQEGIREFSLSMHTYNKDTFIERMDEWGFDINLRDIYSLEEFLQAIILLPRSIISNFDFKY